VPSISAANWAEVRERLGGSHATDVTGGMLAKVEEMVASPVILPVCRSTSSPASSAVPWRQPFVGCNNPHEAR
jgi:hypothetical protein